MTCQPYNGIQILRANDDTFSVTTRTVFILSIHRDLWWKWNTQHLWPNNNVVSPKAAPINITCKKKDLGENCLFSFSCSVPIAVLFQNNLFKTPPNEEIVWYVQPTHLRNNFCLRQRYSPLDLLSAELSLFSFAWHRCVKLSWSSRIVLNYDFPCMEWIYSSTETAQLKIHAITQMNLFQGKSSSALKLGQSSFLDSKNKGLWHSKS